MIKKYFKYALLVMAAFTMAACSSDEEPVNPEPPIPDIVDDLLGGKVFFYINLSDITEGDYFIESSEPIDFYTFSDDNFGVSVKDSDDGQYLSANIPNGFSGERLVFPGYAVGRESGKTRSVIFIVTNDINDENADGNGWADNAKIHTAIGNVIGKGTFCYGELGNGNHNILLYDHIPILDRNLFYFSTDLNRQTMDEIKARSFSSLTEKWGFNIGVSGQYEGFKGGFNFGMNGFKKESNDYEYYMLYYKVEKADMKLHTSEMERMAKRNPEDAAKLLGFFAKGFREAILETCTDKFKPEDFYNEWGTDMITQGTLGGYYNLVFTREENIHMNSIGFDLALYAEYSKEKDEQDPIVKWINKLKEKSEDDDIKGEVKVSYNKEKYFSSTKAEKKTVSKGGNRSIDDPDKWITAFNNDDDADKWNLIQYKTSGDVIEKEGAWYLLPLDQLAGIVVDAVETLVLGNDTNSSDADGNIVANARKNVEKLKNARKSFIERQLVQDPQKSPIVVADVMMVNNGNRRHSGDPQPFLAPDPRDPQKHRMYYPMICNQNFDIKQPGKGMRGKPIDTNDDVFLASGHTSSHYWYYALAHSEDCTPIVDIRFLTEKEAHDNSKYQFYYKRGDHARHGLSGLLAKERYVFVKYQDSGHDANLETPITGFGLYDDHKDYANKDMVQHIIASTPGTELPLHYLQSDYNTFKAFWNTEASVIRNNHFYEGGGVMPHPLKLIYTTKPLDTSDLDALRVSNSTWGNDNFDWEGYEE